MNLANLGSILEEAAKKEFPSATVERYESTMYVQPDTQQPVIVRVSGMDANTTKLVRGSVGKIIRSVSSGGFAASNGIINTEREDSLEKTYSISNGAVPVMRVFVRYLAAKALLTLYIHEPPKETELPTSRVSK